MARRRGRDGDREGRDDDVMTAVLIVNPRSGGGKARQHDLVGQCRMRGIDVVMFEAGADLAALATRAVDNGADIIGVAGGDGSQATVAVIAATCGLPYVCVPAGTRNHFALDLGIDPKDVVGALDAFAEGTERSVDLAQVNGRPFVNNTSMGFYARVVQSPEYRDAKLRTVIKMLPKLLGPTAPPYDLRFTTPEGTAYRTAQLVLVSNNRYELDPRGARGTRGGIDSGTLGVVVAGFPPPQRPLREWSAATFQIESDDVIHVGIDGEAVSMEPPLHFQSMPGALRVRVCTQHRSPAFAKRSVRRQHESAPRG